MFSVSLLSLALLLVAPSWGQRAEQDDPRGVQIIKQINRVNEDGTYTYGYEAADGSFKIETRDVLGNVKGMFGYVDENGELKRVSYSAANGTGFQATDDYGPTEQTTRRPILVYRGTTPHQVQKIPPRRRVSTTPVYEYGTRRPVQEATEAPQRPVRVLVTKRPLGPVLADPRTQELSDVDQNDLDRNTLYRNNVIRRQLGARDNQDLGGVARAIPLPRDYGRYNQQIERPDQREIYRNMLLEQNNLKPEYQPPRPRYYSPGGEDAQEEYPEVGAVVPMVNRVLSTGAGRARPRQTFLRPPPSVVDEAAYPVPPPPIVGRRGPYRGAPPVPRIPSLYDPYSYNGAPIDYEALREEIMNYLIEYIQYRTRGYNGGYNGPYNGGYNGPYNPRYNRPYLGGGYDSVGAGPLPGAGYYQPRIPPYQQDFYNQRYYGGRIGGGFGGAGPQVPPTPVAPPVTPPPPPVAPLPQPGGPLGQSIYPPYAAPGPYGQAGPYGQSALFGQGPYAPPAGPAASYPFVNPNVQYSASEDASGTTTASSTTTQNAEASETLSAFKERMDASDHRDAADTRPPSPGIFKLLLARPHSARTQLLRPSVRSADPLRLEPIRSVEILGTAASENRPSSTTTIQSPSSTTTTEADPMIASSR
ncbi:hypothetical protein GE061_011224 [Apolygus lucorum]|uniref:Cuticle protein 6 n=1 Tax=Apolygus lucorum TaxID=248454 RepID=A0A8S9XY00_APOLU|nr:hypothetical protein GE061_011224 [Apolygus lucorum]